MHDTFFSNMHMVEILIVSNVLMLCKQESKPISATYQVVLNYEHLSCNHRIL